LLRHVFLAMVEIVGIVQETVDAFLEKPLLLGQIKIHVLYFLRNSVWATLLPSSPSSSPRKRGSSNRRCLVSLMTAAAYWVPRLRGGRQFLFVTQRGLQPQHRLGDDVALDLVGAAVDRDLAVVEVARRDLRGPFHLFVGAVVAVLVIGRGERADHFHQEFGGGLLDFRTLDL